MEVPMQQEDWKTKFEQLRRYHYSVYRQWVRTQDAEQEQHKLIVQNLEEQVAKLKKEKKALLLDLEEAHTIGLQSAQQRLAISCELASYKLRNMR